MGLRFPGRQHQGCFHVLLTLGFELVQGGAVSYAAAVLSALGVRSCVVTGKPTPLPKAPPTVYSFMHFLLASTPRAHNRTRSCRVCCYGTRLVVRVLVLEETFAQKTSVHQLVLAQTILPMCPFLMWELPSFYLATDSQGRGSHLDAVMSSVALLESLVTSYFSHGDESGATSSPRTGFLLCCFRRNETGTLVSAGGKL